MKRIRLDLAEVLARAGQKLAAVEQGKLAFGIEPHTVEELVRIEEVFRIGGRRGRRDPRRRGARRAAGGERRAGRGHPGLAGGGRAVDRCRSGPTRPPPRSTRCWRSTPATARPSSSCAPSTPPPANWRAYADLCLLFAPHAEPEERLALLKEVAVLREQRLGEKHMASLAWNRVLGEAPGDEQALAECWRLAHEGKDQDTLAVVHRGRRRQGPRHGAGQAAPQAGRAARRAAARRRRGGGERHPAGPGGRSGQPRGARRAGRPLQAARPRPRAGHHARAEARGGGRARREEGAAAGGVAPLRRRAPRRRRGGGRAQAHPRAGRRRPGRARGAGGALPARAPLGRAGRRCWPGPATWPATTPPASAGSSRSPASTRTRSATTRRRWRTTAPCSGSTTGTPRPWPAWSGSTPSSTASPS